MRAEVLELATRFEVQPNTLGPPDRITLTIRTCWKKPALRLVLVYCYEVDDVAYYQIVERF